jgi:four helix bundle protein
VSKVDYFWARRRGAKMKKITRFEELICWQKARKLVNAVYRLTNQQPFSRDYDFKNQIRSASISAMSNIAEGFSRFHKKDFIRFLDISQSSTSEVKSLLYVALDQNYISAEQFQETQRLADETRQTTLGLLRYVNSTIAQKTNFVKEPRSEYKIRDEVEYFELPEEFIYEINN